MQNNKPVLVLLEQATQYGPVTLERDYIGVAEEVPVELRQAIGLQYFEAQAVLREFICPDSSSPVIAIAEEIARDARSHKKTPRTKSSAKRKRSGFQTSREMPFPWL
jgi:hypothetical protein